jgi:hypothetical protein
MFTLGAVPLAALIPWREWGYIPGDRAHGGGGDRESVEAGMDERQASLPGKNREPPPAREVERARIVLLAADGVPVKQLKRHGFDAASL